MDELLEQIARWRAAGRPVTLARAVAVRGMSSEDPFAALTPGEPVAGSVLSGAADAKLADLIAPHPNSPGRLVEVVVDDADAVESGLSCGGVAQLLVQPADEIPAEAWQLIADREPVCLITALDGGVATTLATRATVAGAEREHPGVARLFARGSTLSALLDEPRTAVTAIWPTTCLVVVGDGLIADALAANAGLLGWTSVVVNDAAAAVAAIKALASNDGVVVLSHSRDVDGPALAAALAGRVGYIGALGARHTQAARADWLAGRGVSDLARVHGPAGLDLGARTPGEIAVAIIAELLAARSGRAPASLRDRSGPVHSDGLTAPPPRYPAGGIEP
ncbi:MAG: XdhC family protein [Jatrophihabitantaceae bacterium]